MNKFLSIVCCVGLLCAQSCKQENKQQQLSKSEIRAKDSLALHVALMPTADCLPFYYAKESGILDSLHVDVRIHTYLAQMDCDTAFTKNHADVAYSDVFRAALMQSKKESLYVVMQTDGSVQLITSRNKRIKTYKQLKEKTIAIARNSVSDYLSDIATDSAAIGMYDAYRPQINNLELRYAMLLNGTIDAAILPEPYSTQALRKGNRMIMDSKKLHQQLTCLIGRAQLVHDKRKTEQVINLIKAYNIAITQMKNGKGQNILRNIEQKLNWESGIVDSSLIAKYSPATRLSDRNSRTALTWLQSRNLVSAKYNIDTLSTIKFVSE